ncbi:hypothetical protein PR048_012788 [Dryococelus australis]|uniref:DDE-1 domain-containing protein n=1 Tax=Dryococelus australis TaxID=614101 RepID=A0ABQ9HQE2_9NEOP|nr:hypothetical protein PR048_012788 [Dryococelus australis]
MAGKRSRRGEATPLQCVMRCEERKNVFLHCDQRHYKRKTQRQSWNEENMKKALEAVAAGMGKKTAAWQFGVSVMTLKRSIFEEELESHMLAMENRMYGLTTLDARCLAYQLVERNDIAHNFSHQNKVAGKGWLQGFCLRHPQLSLRLPESTLVARGMGINKPVVTKFFTLLKEEYKYIYRLHRIFNVDETSLSNVPGKNSKVIAKMGKRQVSRITLADHGGSASAVICASAAGGFIPPMLTFHRQKFKRELEDGALAGTIFACSEKGWMKLSVFEKLFDHFLAHTKPTADDRVLLLLDGHLSHTKNLNVYLMACSPKNAIKGFQKTGIHQYNPDIFSEEYFAPAKTTDENSENGDPDDPLRMERLTHTPQPEPHKLPPSLTVLSPLDKNHRTHTKTVGPQPEMGMSSVKVGGTSSCSPEDIRIFPKIISPPAAALSAKKGEPTMVRKQRKTATTVVLTSTPHKETLEEEINARK